jgi:alpha-ketoglutaric semialdehyde dehydrogenase
MARRAAYLESAASELAGRTEDVARDMTLETGKPLREARVEVERSCRILRFAAGESLRSVGEQFEQAANGADIIVRRRPLGVVGLITPWNFPCAIPVWKLAPALVHGNTVVLKCAYEAPRTGLHLARAFDDAQLPAGVLNVLTGAGASVGAGIVREPAVRAISFTGSVATGHQIRNAATALGKRVQLELGGHNPLIVMADADLDRAVEAAFAGAFWAAGQKCTATRRIFAQDEIYDTFRERLLARIARGKVGDPLDPDVEVGPLVNRSQFAEVSDAIERGAAEGGRVIAGGCPRPDATNYIIEPTVFEGVPDSSFLSCEEIFGPVTTLYRFVTFDEVLARANAVEFGLAASLFTSSLATATRFQTEMQAGLLHINSPTTGADVHVPFGGLKASGFGPHEQGRAARDFYTDTITVYVDP